MANQKFYEAVLRDALPISREYADKGWPPLLYPFFLALVQMPDSDRPAQKAFTLHMRDSIRAGALPAVRQRIPWFIENEVIEPHVTAQDFAAWLASEGVTPSPLVAEWFKHQDVASPAPAPAPAQAAAEPAPVVGDSASSARVVPFKKAALIAAHVHEWPTIERDISDANANGLATAAKAGARGWREADALTWARAKGKLISAAKPADSLTQAMHNLGALPRRKHTIQG